MIYPLIGLTGAKGAGKDTVAEILVRKFGYERTAFADKLKEEVYHYAFLHDQFGSYERYLQYCDQHKHDDLSFVSSWPRLLWQAWGCMQRDLCGENYWIKLIRLRQRLVISDCRFPNEVDAVLQYKHDQQEPAEIWHVIRPGHNGDAHASEAHAEKLPYNYLISNNGSVKDLENMVVAYVEARFDH